MAPLSLQVALSALSESSPLRAAAHTAAGEMGLIKLAVRSWKINNGFPYRQQKVGCPTISLVLREMWDTTALDAQLCRLSFGAKPRICTSPQDAAKLLAHTYALPCFRSTPKGLFDESWRDNDCRYTRGRNRPRHITDEQLS